MKDPPPGNTTAVSEEGFSANLKGASLSDLVQMECFGNSTLAVRVVSGDDEGYLYFHAGQIVHAMSSSAVGEAAALEILAWNRGSFEPCSAGWPSEFTIAKPWQALLMAAATAHDEARRKVVDFPRERTQGAIMSQKPPKPFPNFSQPPTNRSPGAPPPVSTPPQMEATPSTRGIERAVRLEANGRVISARGDADELAAMTAYALRVSALVGDELGMGELRAIETVTNGTRRVFYADVDGKLVGVEARADTDLGLLREKLGL
jgi:predicted regulator of Ras-like GTPase activity (Roadblock/LC7/MglB family)